VKTGVQFLDHMLDLFAKHGSSTWTFPAREIWESMRIIPSRISAYVWDWLLRRLSRKKRTGAICAFVFPDG